MMVSRETRNRVTRTGCSLRDRLAVPTLWFHVEQFPQDTECLEFADRNGMTRTSPFLNIPGVTQNVSSHPSRQPCCLYHDGGVQVRQR